MKTHRSDRPAPPTPVRLVMEGGDAPERPEPGPARRQLDLEGQAWLVRDGGRTRSGTGRDSGAPLILLTFALVEAPEEELREVLGVGGSLEALTDHDLEQLFARSRPVPARPSGSR